jgi:hypothetical protein
MASNPKPSEDKRMSNPSLPAVRLKPIVPANIERLTKPSALAHEFAPLADIEAWARSIVYHVKYREPNPDFITQRLALDKIMADTTDDVFSETGVKGLQLLLPDAESAVFGPFEITDLYVASSSFEEGNPTFVVIGGLLLESGEVFRTTTGATAIQSTLIGLISNDVWPIRAKFKRGTSLDKGGRHLMFLVPPD